MQIFRSNARRRIELEKHVDFVESKLIKYASLFYKIRLKLTPECRKALYYAMIHPHISYAVELYGSATETCIHKLQMLQNKFLRILQLQGAQYPTNQLYVNYNTLKIRDLHEQGLLYLTHKIIHHPNEIPKIYQNYFSLNCDVHYHNTRFKMTYIPIK